MSASRARCPWQVLGISDRVSATDATVKRAYYERAKTLHPDTNPSPAAGVEFSALNEAFETLRDSSKRSLHAISSPSSSSHAYSTAPPGYSTSSSSAGYREAGGGGGHEYSWDFDFGGFGAQGDAAEAERVFRSAFGNFDAWGASASQARRSRWAAGVQNEDVEFSFFDEPMGAGSGVRRGKNGGKRKMTKRQAAEARVRERLHEAFGINMDVTFDGGGDNDYESIMRRMHGTGGGNAAPRKSKPKPRKPSKQPYQGKAAPFSQQQSKAKRKGAFGGGGKGGGGLFGHIQTEKRQAKGTRGMSKKKVAAAEAAKASNKAPPPGRGKGAFAAPKYGGNSKSTAKGGGKHQGKNGKQKKGSQPKAFFY
jgi:curved DNA-binding protein CbpA